MTETFPIQTRSDRLTWQQYFVELVEITARRSDCPRLNVGCILVRDNRIIAAGYNGNLPGTPHVQIMRDGHDIAKIHAEQNAITDCAKRGVSTADCDAYITHFPCVICVKLLISAGIRRIFYINDYRNSSDVEMFCRDSHVILEKVNKSK